MSEDWEAYRDAWWLLPPEVEVCVECGGTLEEPNEDCQDEYHFRDIYAKENDDFDKGAHGTL